MTPSWPQLCGWMGTVELRTLRCAWRSREGGETRSGRALYARDEDDLWEVTDASGRPSYEHGPQELLGLRFERGDDYHRAAGPVVATTHDGRPCWEVSLLPPAHKSGQLVLRVDDETGLCLRLHNADHDRLLELTEVEVDVDLPAELFATAREQEARRERETELYHLVNRRPPPTPRWFPWRRGYLEAPSCWVVEGASGEGMVSRAPLGQVPVTGYFEPDDPEVVRLDHAGWSWAVVAEPPLDLPTARQVVEQVVEGRPYD